MRYVATYRPDDSSRIGRGRREFLYVESLSRDQVLDRLKRWRGMSFTVVAQSDRPPLVPVRP